MVAAFVLLAVILSLLSPKVQHVSRALLSRNRMGVAIIALVLSCVLLGEAARLHALSPRLALLAIGYAVSPTLVLSGQKPGAGASWHDLAAILLLWLPARVCCRRQSCTEGCPGYLAYGRVRLSPSRSRSASFCSSACCQE